MLLSEHVGTASSTGQQGGGLVEAILQVRSFVLPPDLPILRCMKRHYSEARLARAPACDKRCAFCSWVFTMGFYYLQLSIETPPQEGKYTVHADALPRLWQAPPPLLTELLMQSRI